MAEVIVLAQTLATPKVRVPQVMLASARVRPLREYRRTILGAAVESQIMNYKTDLPDKRIIVEFIGGDADGEHWDSSDRKTEMMAVSMYLGTQGGITGRGVRSMPLAKKEELLKGNSSELTPYHPHEYRIMERLETDTGLLLRLKYIGQTE